MKIVRGNRKGFAIVLIGALALTLIPMVGLALDVAILYVLKARLSAACDAAALAAARNMNVGRTMTEQVDSARDRAISFFNANFPDSFLGSHRNTPTVEIPANQPNNRITITTNGSATANTYFMRALGVNSLTIAASGTATRQDVNIVMVLDRSSSMNASNSCAPMKEAAIKFVNRFVDGRDHLGMVTFGSNYVVQPSSVNFKSGSNNLPTLIDSLGCGDNTAMTKGFWEGYKELQAQNLPSALNALVLFTDGIPNGVYADFAVRTSTDNRYGYAGGPTSCNSTDTECVMPVSPCANTIQPLRGILTQWAGFANTGKTAGPWYPQGASITSHGGVVVSGQTGCEFNNGADRVRRDIREIPTIDADGNYIAGYSNQYRAFTASDYIPGGGTSIRVDSPATIGVASSNSLDHAAMRVRARTLNANIPVTVYVIGLGSYSDPEAPDDVLLRRVANDPLSNIYDNTAPTGMYIRATDQAQMARAFQDISSEIFRLSH